MSGFGPIMGPVDGGECPDTPGVLVLAPKTMGGDGCPSAPVGDCWGPFGIQPGDIRFVWTVCGQDEMT